MAADTVVHLARVEPDRIPAAAHFLGSRLPVWLEAEITRRGGRAGDAPAEVAAGLTVLAHHAWRLPLARS